MSSKMFFVTVSIFIVFNMYGFFSPKDSFSVLLCGLKKTLNTARIGWERDVAVYSILESRLPNPQSHVPCMVFLVLPLNTRMKPKIAIATDAIIIRTTGMERLAKLIPELFCTVIESNGLDGCEGK